MLSLEQQIKEQLNQSNNILITTAKYFSGDQLGTALAWYWYLKKLNKNIEIVIDNYQPLLDYNFLSGDELIKKELTHLKKLTLSLDVSQSDLEELSYDIVDKELLIYLTPKKGVLRQEDLKFKDNNYRFDLIITLGCQDLNSLGKVYDDHPDFFYKTTIINVDYASQNERFGQINLIDLNKIALAEITYELFKKLNESLIDDKIATALLTGLTAATNSFKSLRLTPESLINASQLIALGADKEKIITNLYRNKNITTLNLWGKILTNLKEQEKIIWSSVTLADQKNHSPEDNDFINVINELLTTARQADILIIFVEEASGTKVYLYNNNLNYNLTPLVSRFNAQGDKKLIIFKHPANLENCQTEFLKELREFLTNINK